jgi:hypothetical protein
MMDYVFIHIPKSAGTFTMKNICNVNDNVHQLDTHFICISDSFISERIKNNKFYNDICFKNYKNRVISIPGFGYNMVDNELFKDSIKFTIIRNPYDLLSSYFISRWGDYNLAMFKKLPKLEFNDLVKEFCNTNKNWHIPFFRDFLYFQCFDDDGNSKCDYAIIYDDVLDTTLTKFTSLNKLNYSRGDKINKTNKSNYKNYYTPESIELISKKCKLELDMFNFDFSGYNGKEKIIEMKNFKIDWDKII